MEARTSSDLPAADEIASVGEMQVLWLGTREYADVWALQKTRVEQRIRDEVGDALLLVEHPPVITLGRGEKGGGVVDPRFPVVEVERGGEATYHGPGQLVGYPIVKLPPERRDAHRFLRDLEEVLLRTVDEFGLVGHRALGKTGVWVGERKVASIGIAIRKWVTYHGFALNLSTDLTHFRAIHPCGMPPEVMTSMEKELGRAPDFRAVRDRAAAHFIALFG